LAADGGAPKPGNPPFDPPLDELVELPAARVLDDDPPNPDRPPP
jgi:hypothetical protein